MWGRRKSCKFFRVFFDVCVTLWSLERRDFVCVFCIVIVEVIVLRGVGYGGSCDFVFEAIYLGRCLDEIVWFFFCFDEVLFNCTVGDVFLGFMDFLCFRGVKLRVRGRVMSVL